MKESELQDAVVELARRLGFLVVHFRAARTKDSWITPVAYDGKGYPDLTFIGHGYILFRELKGSTGSLRPEQKMWAERLIEGGHDYDCWWPIDWVNGTIEKELKRYANRDVRREQ